MISGNNIPNKKLAPREIEVMTLTARGKTTTEIAMLLSIAEDTVKTHIKRSCQKLNAANKTHAVALVMARGIIECSCCHPKGG
ncbi:MAG: helix-turn-helix transcriptional regulator [Alphaproteobacteria bacterium]